mgnify:CR=1 FL=1
MECDTTEDLRRGVRVIRDDRTERRHEETDRVRAHEGIEIATHAVRAKRTQILICRERAG